MSITNHTCVSLLLLIFYPLVCCWSSCRNPILIFPCKWIFRTMSSYMFYKKNIQIILYSSLSSGPSFPCEIHIFPFSSLFAYVYFVLATLRMLETDLLSEMDYNFKSSLFIFRSDWVACLKCQLKHSFLVSILYISPSGKRKKSLIPVIN